VVSKGSRNRTRRNGGFDLPPPRGAMWSKGFDASPFSTAGEVQRFGAFFDGLASGSARTRKAMALAVGLVLVFVLLLLVAWGISALVH